MKKYFVLKHTKHNYGRLVFDPEEPSYDGRYSTTPPASTAVGRFDVTSPITRNLNVDLVSANRGDLCSKKVADQLIHSGAECTLIPCHAFLKNGTPVERDFFFIFIKHQIPCLDWKGTSFEVKEGIEKSGDVKPIDVESMWSIKVDDQLIGDRKIFYISNSPFHYLPIVSSELGHKLIDAKLKGIDIIPLDEFSYAY